MVKGGGSKNAVVVVQGLDVHHAKVQQLWRGQRSEVSPVERCLCLEKAGLQYLSDLNVGLLGELRNQKVAAVLLGLNLHVEVKPGDGGLWTQVPVQCLKEEEAVNFHLPIEAKTSRKYNDRLFHNLDLN